jgi:hypothetical protein
MDRLHIDSTRLGMASGHRTELLDLLMLETAGRHE